MVTILLMVNRFFVGVRRSKLPHKKEAPDDGASSVVPDTEEDQALNVICVLFSGQMEQISIHHLVPS